jgi:tetratricopeptide (TPR) repeat protein
MTRPRGAGPHPALSYLAIALAVVFVYEPVRDFPFVVFDDKALVSENPMVTGGLSREGVRAAFTRSEHGNYAPLTWLSHMLDVELFGLDARGHHVVNALLHLLASLLLLLALRRLSGAPWPSAFCAAAFALHPTHVESVAWVAERRDTLSAVFFALTLLCFAGFARAERRRGLRQAALCAALAAGLLAKTMLVSVPFVLLLLDVWPLRRGSLGHARLLAEKLPLLALAALAAAAALASQGGAGAVATLAQLPLADRVANALVSYVAYLGKAVWPLDLAVFYPYEQGAPPWKGLAAGGVLALLSAAALAQWRARPWLAVGWLWYLVMLAPVIGLVQVGSQAMADRYTYLPSLGLWLAAAWSAAELAAARPRARRAVAVAALAWLAACAVLARQQVWTWRDSVTLFEHARAVVGDHPIVLANLGEAYEDAGRSDLALAHYEDSLEGFGDNDFVHARVGALRLARGDLPRAAFHLRRAIELAPDEPGPRTDLAVLLLRSGRADAAEAELLAERRLAASGGRARLHLGEIAVRRGDEAAAAALFAEAFAREPALAPVPVFDQDAQVARALAGALAAAGRREDARRLAGRALTLARLSGDAELAARLERDLAGLGPAPQSR